MMSGFTESVITLAALGWFDGLGYVIARGTGISPEGGFSCG